MIVAVERGDRSLSALKSDGDDLAIAAVSVAELLTGVHLADDARRATRQAATGELVSAFPVLVYGDAEARVHAELLAFTTRTGRPRGAHDLIIAATARATGRIVVTLDRRGFDGLPGVEVRAPAA